MVSIIHLGYKVTEGTVPSTLHAYVTGQNYMYIQIRVFKTKVDSQYPWSPSHN